MKFSEIARGTRSDEDIELPRYDGQPEDMPALHCRVRGLNGIEEELSLASATRRAKAQGVENPQVGNPIFDLALMVETIALACLDLSSTPDKREPFFDGGADQIRTWYGREGITLIYELQQEYQDRVAPTIAKLSEVEFFTGLLVLGGEDEAEARRFFSRLRPGLRWSYVRSMAAPQRIALLRRLAPGSDSETNSKNDKSDSKTNNENNDPTPTL